MCPPPPPGRAAAAAALAYRALNSGRATGVLDQTPAVSPVPTPSKNSRHPVEARAVGERGVDDLGERARAGRPHQRPGGDQIGEVERGDASAASRAAPPASFRWRGPAELLERGEVLLQRGAVLDAHAVRLEPLAVGLRPGGSRAGGADVGHVGAALDRAGARPAARSPRSRETVMRPLIGAAASAPRDRRQHPVLGRVDLRSARDAAGRRRSRRAMPRCRRGRPAPSRRPCARRPELADGGGVEGVDRGDGRAVERGVQLAPLARRHHRARRPGPAAPASCRCPPGRRGTSRRAG